MVANRLRRAALHDALQRHERQRQRARSLAAAAAPPREQPASPKPSSARVVRDTPPTAHVRACGEEQVGALKMHVPPSLSFTYLRSV